MGKRQLCNHPKDKDKDWGSGNGSSHYCGNHQRFKSKLEWLVWLDWQLGQLGEGPHHSSRIHIEGMVRLHISGLTLELPFPRIGVVMRAIVGVMNFTCAPSGNSKIIYPSHRLINSQLSCAYSSVRWRTGSPHTFT